MFLLILYHIKIYIFIKNNQNMNPNYDSKKYLVELNKRCAEIASNLAKDYITRGDVSKIKVEIKVKRKGLKGLLGFLGSTISSSAEIEIE